MILHNVFFSIVDNSDAACRALLDYCLDFPREISDIAYHTAGLLCREVDRPVSDRDFDVHLLVVLKDLAALDRYAAAPSHTAFVEKHKANWARIRVFDSTAPDGP